MLPPSAAICLIGFGETGRIFGVELAARGCAVRGYDPQLEDPVTREAMQQRIEDAGVHPAALADALHGAKLVICVVSADNASATLRSAAALLQRGQIFLDVSDAPAAQKCDRARQIEASGADYVDGAFQASAAMLHLAGPMQLGGLRAAELAPALNALGFHTAAVSDSAGFEREHPAVTVRHAPAEDLTRRQSRRGELP